MLRKILKINNPRLSDAAINEVIEMADADIKANRLFYGKFTPAIEVVNITLRCLRTYERCV